MVGINLLQVHTFFIQHKIEVSVEFDEKTALPPEQEPPYLLDRLLRRPQSPSGDFGKGDIQSTIFQLSIQYPS